MAVRLPFIGNEGLPSDIQLFVAWSKTAADDGLAGLYDRPDYNYLPLTSYLFVGLGRLQRDILDLPFSAEDPSMRAILKAPAILSDLAITVVLYLSLVRRTSRRVATSAALAYALNPAVIHDSVVWGQWDSLVALPALLAIVGLITSRPRLAVAFLTTAVLVKFQAIILAPVAFVTILRTTGWRGVMSSSLVSAIVAFVLLIPIITAGLLPETIETYSGLTHTEPWVSSNAFNIWWLVNWFVSDTPAMTLRGYEPLFGPISYRAAGLVLFALVLATIAVTYSRTHISAATISLASGTSVIAFFTLAPEMRERYLFLAVPLLALSIDVRGHRHMLAVISLTMFLSMYWVYQLAMGNAWSTWQLAMIALLSAVNVAALVWACTTLFRYTRPDRQAYRRVQATGVAMIGAVAVLATYVVVRWYLLDVRA